MLGRRFRHDAVAEIEDTLGPGPMVSRMFAAAFFIARAAPATSKARAPDCPAGALRAAIRVCAKPRSKARVEADGIHARLNDIGSIIFRRVAFARKADDGHM